MTPSHLRGGLAAASLPRAHVAIGLRHVKSCLPKRATELRRTRQETSLIPTLAQPDAAAAAAGTDPLAKLGAGTARGALALGCLCLLALSPALFSPFFADDYFHIEHVARLRDSLTHGWVLPIDTAGAWWTPAGLSVEYFRPVVVLSFAFDHLLYGEHAAGYHLTNLLLHVTTTLLLWGIARRVIGAGFSAWAAAALFAIHPAHTVGVSWISGRTDVLATVFYAAAFLLYLESRPLRRGSASRLGLSCLAFGFALFAKEMAITFPAVVLAHSLLRRDGEALPRRLVAPFVAGLVAVAYLVVRVVLLGGFRAPPPPFAYHAGDPGLALHLLTAPLLYLADLVMFVPPDPMATLPFWQAHPALLAAFLAFIVFVFAGTLRKAPSRVVAAWGLGWMAITILPVMMLTVGEHFLYLPSMGYCVLVASQLPVSPASVDAKQRRGLAIVAVLVLLVCVGRTAMFASFSRSASRTIAETVAALDGARESRRVLVADLPASAALAFPNAVRLARPGRDLDVQILSVVPRVMPDADDLSIVTFTAPDRLELRRASAYLHSYLERAFEGPLEAFHAGQTIERPGYAITVLEVDPASRPLAFGVRLFDPATTLVLGRASEERGAGLQPISPH